MNTNCKNRSEEQFERDMRASRRYLTVMAYRIARTPEDAEDLIAETYARAWQYYHQQDSSRATFTRWASRILLNLGRDAHRSSRRQPATQPLQDAELHAASVPGPAEVVERRMEVQDLLHSLSPKQREILLRLANGQTYEEIGRSMGIVVGTVKSRVFHLRNVVAPRLMACRTATASDLQPTA